MDRADLERLDRTALIARAEGLGVTRANILTRPELVDELLVRTARAGDKDLPKARGFFGRARDLVARVIEKGLHLPDAAERFRSVTVAATQIAVRVVPAVVPTVTLAEIYAAQGHRPRAIDTLRRVLDLEPDHTTAQALLTKLESSAPLPDAPVVPAEEPEDEERSGSEEGSDEREQSAPGPQALPKGHVPGGEPLGFLDDEPPPTRYDVDECVAIAVDPVTLYAYWEIRDATLDYLRASRPDGQITLRLLIITPTWDGPRSATRDLDVDSPYADRFVRDLPAGAIVRVAIGWRTGDAFLPIAHAPALETPPGAPCPILAESFVRWTPHGLVSVSSSDADYASIGRALGQFAPHRGGSSPYQRLRSALGSSDVSAGFPSRQDEAPALSSSRVSV